VFPARRPAPRRSARPLVYGAALGLVLGAGGVLGAYFGGALPDRNHRPIVLDNTGVVANLRAEAETARKEAAQAKTDLDRRVAAATGPLDTRINNLSQEVQKAQAQAAANKKSADEAVRARRGAEREAADATAKLTEATKARTLAESNLAAAKQEAAEAQKSAGEVRAAAEVKERDAAAKAAEATKKVTDLTALADAAKKSADDARKAADEAVRARDASEATVQAISERLARAKLVPDKADATALLRGIDDALKASAGDAAQALRDELAATRQQEAKVKAELAAAREKEVEATKTAAAATAEARKLAADLARAKTATDRAEAAERDASVAREAADKAATELTRLRVENDRLARDLEAIKELAEMIKTPTVAISGPAIKPDPARYAEQFFGDGLRAYHGGRYAESESSFRKAIQFRPADARFHYLLGLTLWARNDTAGAEAEFEKGRDLETQSRPSSRVIGAALERIQGPARQAVDAYRP
jgi:hypothetical protein